MHRLVAALCGLVLMSVMACAQSPEDLASSLPESEAEMIDVPAGLGSGQPFLHATPDGTLWMSWIERIDSTRSAFRYASFDGARWSEPTTIASRADLFVNPADIPKVYPLPTGRLAAHYMVEAGSSYFAYDLRVARQAADGTWPEATTPYQDQTPAQHGFASAVSWKKDQLLTVWLDGRKTNVERGESKWGEMTLRAALIGPDGVVREQTLLDGRVCDCCATSAVRTGAGALVAYRNRSEKEIRDISLLRFDRDEGWSEPYALHEDGWEIEGCPVNGPALDADGDRVAAAWFTAAQGNRRVHVAFSTDGGRTFGAPTVVDDDRPRGRVDVVLLDDGSALVSWIGTEERMMAVKVRRVHPQGGPGTASTIVKPQSPAFVGTPQMVRSGRDLYVAWGDGGDPQETVIQLARPSVQDFIEEEERRK